MRFNIPFVLGNSDFESVALNILHPVVTLFLIMTSMTKRRLLEDWFLKNNALYV
jgi:hypothetical protein